VLVVEPLQQSLVGVFRFRMPFGVVVHPGGLRLQARRIRESRRGLIGHLERLVGLPSQGQRSGQIEIGGQLSFVRQVLREGLAEQRHGPLVLAVQQQLKAPGQQVLGPRRRIQAAQGVREQGVGGLGVLVRVGQQRGGDRGSRGKMFRIGFALLADAGDRGFALLLALAERSQHGRQFCQAGAFGDGDSAQLDQLLRAFLLQEDVRQSRVDFRGGLQHQQSFVPLLGSLESPGLAVEFG